MTTGGPEPTGGPPHPADDVAPSESVASPADTGAPTGARPSSAVDPVEPLAPADPGPAASSVDPVEARPPQGPVRFIGLVAILTVPLALLAAAMGDVVLGLAALLSAAWAGSLAYLGATARARADGEGVTVTWMRRTQSAPWADVRAVEAVRRGRGAGRGATLVLADGSALRFTPWVPFLWFAGRSADASTDALGVLLVRAGTGLELVDPAAEGSGPGAPSGAPQN